mgnify:FL=1
MVAVQKQNNMKKNPILMKATKGAPMQLNYKSPMKKDKPKDKDKEIKMKPKDEERTTLGVLRDRDFSTKKKTKELLKSKDAEQLTPEQRKYLKRFMKKTD